MKIPFKIPLFRRKKLNKPINEQTVFYEITKDVEVDFEKEQLLSNLDTTQLERLFFKCNLDKDSISLEFLRKLISSPILLEYLVNNFFEEEVINKINIGNLRISDIKNYDSKLFQFDIFSDEDNEVLEILRKKINLSDTGYADFSFEDFEKNINSSNYIDNYIDSLIEGESLHVSKTKAISLTQEMVYSYNEVRVATPLDSDSIFCKDIFDYYYSGDLSFNKDTIIFISYAQFLEWIKDNEKKEILKKSQVVINDDYVSANSVRFSIKDFKVGYNLYSSKNDKVDKLLIQINHLLYLLDKSELDNVTKEYYKYHITKNFLSINNKFNHNFYYEKEKLRDLAIEIENRLNDKFIKKMTKDFNSLSIEEKNKNVEQTKFSAGIFLKQFPNFYGMEAFNFLNYVSVLNNDERNIVLSNDIVINKLRGLLNEIDYNEYHGYEEICRKLSVSEIFKIFDANFIKNFYKNNSHFYQYRFFFKIIESDVNTAVKYLLSDDDYFNQFIKDIDKYSFSSLDYSLLIMMLKKIEQSDFNVNLGFLGTIDSVSLFKILKEDFTDDFLVKIVKNSNKKVQQFFYLEDKRFNYLWDKFNILDLSSSNYKFSDDVVNKSAFFDRFKGTSMVQFRANVNQFLIHQPDIFFEEKIDKYEDELVSSFDLDSGLFIQYKYLLDNIEFLEDRNFKYHGIDFFYDSDTNVECRKYIDYDDNGKIYIRNKEKFTNYLKWLSKRKLNEIMADKLFKDNIYNVFLNIKEMLRYNKDLSVEEKVLNEEHVEFYETILNIDNLDKEVILDLYNKFKDKNVALMFYEDLRKVKEKSYDKIKEDMFQPEDSQFMKDKDLSIKYGVPVFDLRNNDYVMLVRCLWNAYGTTGHNRRDCYTLLSSDNSKVFHEDAYIYGYSGFDNDCVLHVFEGDSFSGDIKWSDLNAGSDRVNRIMTSREIATNSSWYSEVQIVNKKSNEKTGMFDTLRPSFLVVYDEINEKTVKEAKRMNIPICIISHELDLSLEGKIPFNDEFGNDTDKYTREWGIINENERRKSR